MAERLVILSDMWGSRRGLWITSYLGYLQQYFDIVYYDSQELAGLDMVVKTRENLCRALVEGGYDTAVAQLLAKEKTPSHYLTFCAGGTIAWRAALKGLPMQSLYAISPLWMEQEQEKPDCSVKFLFGELHQERPGEGWAEEMGVDLAVVPNFGRELYSDEKIIRQVSLELLDALLSKRHKSFKRPLSIF